MRQSIPDHSQHHPLVRPSPLLYCLRVSEHLLVPVRPYVGRPVFVAPQQRFMVIYEDK